MDEATVSYFEEEVAKRKPAYTLRRSRMEIRFSSDTSLFPLRERNMREVRKFEEEAARQQGLDPFYLWPDVPAPGLAWCESKPMYVGKIFADLADAGLVLIDVYSYMYEKTKKGKDGDLVVEMFRNVLVYQCGADPNPEALALAEPVIADIATAGFQFGSVFINRNQNSETRDWWRGDAIELSAPTSRPRATPSLRLNDGQGNFTYALEASDLPPKEVRKERTLEDWVAVAVRFAEKYGTPALTLKEWRGADVRMAAAKELGLDPEDYRHCAVDEEGN